jgi:hypothetical protein
MAEKKRKPRETTPEVKAIMEVQATLKELKKYYVARKRLPDSIKSALDKEIAALKAKVNAKINAL